MNRPLPVAGGFVFWWECYGDDEALPVFMWSAFENDISYFKTEKRMNGGIMLMGVME